MNLQKTNVFLSAVVCLLLSALIVVVLVTGNQPVDESSGGGEDGGGVRKLTVNTIPAEGSESFEIRRIYTGVTRAGRTVDLGFSRPGRITRILAEKGEDVCQGDALATLDTQNLELQKIKLEDALDKVSSRSGGQQGAGVTETDLDLLELEIADSVLSAPFDGIISSRQMDVGSVASPGHPVFQIVKREELEIWIGVPVEVAETMYVGDVHSLKIGDSEISAPLTAILPEVDMNTRTRSIVFTLNREDSWRHLPGEVARFELSRKIESAGFWMPLTSLTRETRGLWSVFAVEKEAEGEEQHVVRHYVEVIHVEGDQAWIRGTLGKGAAIIADGTYRIVPGQRVRVEGEEPEPEVETKAETEVETKTEAEAETTAEPEAEPIITNGEAIQ